MMEFCHTPADKNDKQKASSLNFPPILRALRANFGYILLYTIDV